jgi:hypothetical protein
MKKAVSVFHGSDAARHQQCGHNLRQVEGRRQLLP